MTVSVVELQQLRILRDEQAARDAALVKLPQLEMQHKREQETDRLTRQHDDLAGKYRDVAFDYASKKPRSDADLAFLADEFERAVRRRRDMCNALANAAQELAKARVRLAVDAGELPSDMDTRYAAGEIRSAREAILRESSAYPIGEFKTPAGASEEWRLFLSAVGRVAPVTHLVKPSDLVKR